MEKEESREQKNIIMDAINELTKLHGYPPTIREIAAHTNISKSAVGRFVKKLQEENRLSPSTDNGSGDSSDPSKGKIRSRSSVPLGNDSEERFYEYIPFLGNEAIRTGDFGSGYWKGSLKVPIPFFGDGDLFALLIEDERLCSEKISLGDIIMINQSMEMNDGDLLFVYENYEPMIGRIVRNAGLEDMEIERWGIHKTNHIVKSPMVIGVISSLIKKGSNL